MLHILSFLSNTLFSFPCTCSDSRSTTDKIHRRWCMIPFRYGKWLTHKSQHHLSSKQAMYFSAVAAYTKIRIHSSIALHTDSHRPFFGYFLYTRMHTRTHERTHTCTHSKLKSSVPFVRARNCIEWLCNYYFIFRWKYFTISTFPSVSLITRSSLSNCECFFASFVLFSLLFFKTRSITRSNKP